MKLKITLMTENDKHVDESYTDEDIVKLAEIAWNVILAMMSDPNEKGFVENIELIER